MYFKPVRPLANSQVVFNIGEGFLLLIKRVIKHIDSFHTNLNKRQWIFLWRFVLRKHYFLFKRYHLKKTWDTLPALWSYTSWPSLWAQSYSPEYLWRFLPTARGREKRTLYLVLLNSEHPLLLEVPLPFVRCQYCGTDCTVYQVWISFLNWVWFIYHLLINSWALYKKKALPSSCKQEKKTQSFHLHFSWIFNSSLS